FFSAENIEGRGKNRRIDLARVQRLQARGVIAGRQKIHIFPRLQAGAAKQRHRGQVGLAAEGADADGFGAEIGELLDIRFHKQEIAELVLGGHDQLDRQAFDRAGNARTGAHGVVEIVGKKRIGRNRAGDLHMLGGKAVLGVEAFALGENRRQKAQRRRGNADADPLLGAQLARRRNPEHGADDQNSFHATLQWQPSPGIKSQTRATIYFATLAKKPSASNSPISERSKKSAAFMPSSLGADSRRSSMLAWIASSRG